MSTADLAITLAGVVAILGYTTFPAGRPALTRYVLLARRMYVEWPLRLITGRWRPDYLRISTLEYDLGMGIVEPSPWDEAWDEASTAVRISLYGSLHASLGEPILMSPLGLTFLDGEGES